VIRTQSKKLVSVVPGAYSLGTLTPTSNTLEQGRQSITPLCARCSLETAVPRTSLSLLD